MNLQAPQIITSAGHDVLGELDDATMLGVKAYAAHVRAGERTVRTWLADGRLHSAVKGPDGAWMIAAGDRPADPTAGAGLDVMLAAEAAAAAAVVPHVYPRGSSELGAFLVERGLADAPAFLPLDEASRLLGVPVSAIRRHRDYFELVPFGEHGALVMPAARVRVIAGI